MTGSSLGVYDGLAWCVASSGTPAARHAYVNVARQWRESAMKVLVIFQSLTVSFMLCELGLANNNACLPGDAFFPTQLTEEGLGRVKASKDGPIFDYSSLGGYEGA